LINSIKSLIYNKLHFKWFIFQFINIKYDLRLSYQLNKDAVHILQEIFLKSMYEYSFNENPKVVIDIGGHYGYFALYATRKFGSNCRILSVEPSFSNIRIFNKNIASANVKNVTLVEGALSGEDSQRDLYLSHSQNHSLYQDYSPVKLGSENINCFTLKSLLDKYNLDQIDLLKMDCEGSEHEILLQSDKVTLSRIHYLFVEMHHITHDTYSIEKTLNHLKTNHFQTLPSNSLEMVDYFQYINFTVFLQNKYWKNVA
jgi:FkbM family methyltransferase